MRKKFSYTTIKDNVQLLDEATIAKINEVVVKAGHQLLKKKRKGIKKVFYFYE